MIASIFIFATQEPPCLSDMNDNVKWMAWQNSRMNSLSENSCLENRMQYPGLKQDIASADFDMEDDFQRSWC